MSEEQQSGQYRVVMWQRLDTVGTEVCSVISSATGAQTGNLLVSHVQVALDGTPLEYRCIVNCDAVWRTMDVQVFSSRRNLRYLRVQVEDDRWLVS
jgi:hypothetical protein